MSVNKFKSICLAYRLEILLGILVFITYAYFFSTGAWGQNARLDPIYSFVEPGTKDYLSVRIDRFIFSKSQNTGDWSYYRKHFYSNKAPGTILLGIPYYFCIYHLEKFFNIDPNDPYVEIANVYLLNLFLSVFIGALGMVFFYRLLLLLEISPPRALLLTLILAFSTCMFPYSSQLWGVTTAAVFLIFSLYNLFKKTTCNLIWAGFWIGMAALTDYFAVVFVLIIGVYSLIKDKKRVLWYALGGMGPLVVFMLYHYLCFGGPLVLATHYTNSEFVDPEMYFGMFALPSAEYFYELLFGLRRGMLTQMPVLWASVFAFAIACVKSRKDLKLWVCASGILILLMINAGFYGWHGGATVCARYQIICLPMWVLLMIYLPNKPFVNGALIVLTIFSALNMLVVAAVSPIMPQKYLNPLYGTSYKYFFMGEFSPYQFPIRLQELNPRWPEFCEYTSWNLGSLIGLKNSLSIMPLVIVLIAIAFILYRELRKLSQKDPESQSNGNEV